ncbi:MAG: O-antigen ligase family protein [Limisphaerales bacterium]
MDVERWDDWLERAILGLVAAALGLAVLAFGGVRIQEFLIVEGLVAASAVLWLVRIWTVRSHRLLWPPVCWAVLAFAAWAAWRTWEAEVQVVAWNEWVRIATYTTLFFVAVNNLHRQSTTQGLAWFLIGLATLLCFYGAWQFAMSSNTVWGFDRGEGYAHRASGSYVCPNHFAGLLEMLIPIALATVVAGRISPVGRILLAYSTLAMLAGLALTLSRGGWIAGGVGILLVLVSLARHRDYRWAALASIGVLLLIGGVASTKTRFLQKRLAAADDLNPQARNTRPMIWSAATKMWRDHPWLGVGPGHFSVRFKQYRTHWVDAEPERAHNDYLDGLAEWGLAGAAVVGTTWVLFALGGLRTLRQVRRDPGNIETKRSSRYTFVLGALCGLGALLVHSFADFNLHIPANAMVAVILLALFTGYSRYATDNDWVSSKVPWRAGISVVVAALAALLAWDCWHRGRETAGFLQGRRVRDGSNEQIEAFLEAWKVEPRNAITALYLGEAYRVRSWAGAEGYEKLAEEAHGWFQRAALLNPYDPIPLFRSGMCLDWIGRHDEAAPFYDAAVKVDPQGRITSFHVGWHHLQSGDPSKAREWFLRSIEQGYPPYGPAETYLRLIDRDRATSQQPSQR